jgi:ABC-type sugar transport system permease subunit
VAFGRTSRIRSGGLTRYQLGYILVAPALVLIAFVSVFPFLTTLTYSFRQMRLNIPTAAQPFVGLKNYIILFQSGRFLNSLKLTFLFAASFVSLQLVFGLFIAQVLNLNFVGRALVRASILIPWAMALVITAILWQWMYNAVFGVLNSVLLQLGILKAPYDFLGASAWSAYLSVLLVEMWRNTPFMAIILLAGLQSIPEELYEAATIDGAGRLQSFLRITLPQLKHAVLVALLFRSIDAIRAFDLLFVLTQGGPGTSTEIGSLFSYKLLFQYLDFGRGSASTIVLALFTTVLSVVYINVLSIRED